MEWAGEKESKNIHQKRTLHKAFLLDCVNIRSSKQVLSLSLSLTDRQIHTHIHSCNLQVLRNSRLSKRAEKQKQSHTRTFVEKNISLLNVSNNFRMHRRHSNPGQYSMLLFQQRRTHGCLIEHPTVSKRGDAMVIMQSPSSLGGGSTPCL